MTTTWSLRIDTYNGDILDFYETTAATRADALHDLHTAAIAAVSNVAADQLPLKPRYILELDRQFHAEVVTGGTTSGTPDHDGARIALEHLHDRYCNTK
ncbi:hypothetical protein [Aldersonia kunmingensis]|uniref:hypothetical protein n=1 Tax=Aldersonia kunmingensis TaxID=408066 RepID=UPI0008358B3F|nr:hypothetical protein [Aldersonia kunmingensis]